MNCIVWATLHAQEEGISRDESNDMPLLPWFGQGFEWALRDVINQIGSYDQLYEKHFGRISSEERGRNQLNEGGPLVHSIPGLSH